MNKLSPRRVRVWFWNCLKRVEELTSEKRIKKTVEKKKTVKEALK